MIAELLQRTNPSEFKAPLETRQSIKAKRIPRRIHECMKCCGRTITLSPKLVLNSALDIQKHIGIRKPKKLMNNDQKNLN